MVLTVVKRSGREESVTVVPVAAEALGVARTVAPRAREVRAVERGVAGVAVPERVPPVGRPVTPPPPPPVEPPEGMPLRYSGSLAGVEVEVRGTPVTVSELTEARVILINANGLWIRIRIPPGGGEPESEVVRR